MRRRPRPPRARAEALRPLLLALDAAVDRSGRIAADPVEFPRRYADPGDQEVVGLIAAALAYGRADLFKPVLARLFAQLGPHPSRAVEAFAAAPDPAALGWFRYRFNQPADLAALLAAIGHLRLVHGSLGRRFARLLAEAGGGPEALRPALAALAAELREAPPVGPLLAGRGPRGLRHLLPDPAGPGAAKRWQLYLRWMVRGPDGVDLGAWPAVPAAALLVPLDTHLLRVARRLGLTGRRDASWRTAEAVTAALRLVDPADPVRFDFALCHLGMSGACPARLTAAHCAACPMAGACRHASSAAAPRPRAGRGSARARTR
jgi:uncharacterized protein (TIGR02757 family)